MDNQKAENILNLALDATETEREKSPALSVGYDREEKRWELIIKYSGDLSEVTAALPGVRVLELSGGYAIVTVPESQIEPLMGFSQVEYVEKPKRLYFSISKGKSVSCINSLQAGRNGLAGRGVLVAVIDSGIDYFHQDFRKENGDTRILALWDQERGKLYSEQQINEALKAGSRAAGYQIVPHRDLSGHGTAVAGIAAGNGREENGRHRGVAYESSILAVKLGAPRPDSFPRTTELMSALDFVINEGIERRMPLAVNLSFGNTYGSHDGTSLLETFIDQSAARGKTAVIVGTGNEGGNMGHTAGILAEGRPADVELSVAVYETGFGVQLWKLYEDDFDISIVSPGGTIVGPVNRRLGPQRIQFPGTTVLLYYGEPSPHSKAQEIYMDFIPEEDFVDSGIWRFRLTPRRIVVGQYDLWLPAGNVLNRATRFLYPVPDTTLTIPSTAFRAISVAAYDDSYLSYADFSGRGYTRLDTRIKPDIAAPGVNIVAPKAGGGYEAVTGTSFATPFVTGSAALLMQWGIVDGRDPFLYGEKLKAYLINGAGKLPAEEVYPNPRLGWGTLCVKDSLPE